MSYALVPHARHHLRAGLLVAWYLLAVSVSSVCAASVFDPQSPHHQHSHNLTHSALCSLACQGQTGEGIPPQVWPGLACAGIDAVVQPVRTLDPECNVRPYPSRAPPVLVAP